MIYADCPSYIFRYLLFMYQILQNDEFCSFSKVPTESTGISKLHRIGLLDHIKEICKGHLRWVFEKNVLLASESWPVPPHVKEVPDTFDNGVDEKAFTGSLQILKLFEFTKLFKGEMSIVHDCLQRGVLLWLDALDDSRDLKSELWYKDTRKTYIAWEGYRHEGSEWLDLPEYRLSDLIFIWKALKSVEELTHTLEDAEYASDILNRLKELSLRPADIQARILQSFLYQVPNAHPAQSIDPSKPKLGEKNIETTEANTSPFSIAVRRSRERDRRLFYAKDTMLYDGIKWGFFQDEIQVQTLTAENEIRKANVQLSWQNTLQAQGVDREAIWDKPLRYAQAIIMADLISLDKTQSSKDLEESSWKILSKCVLPCGLFATWVDWDTKLPDRLPLEGSQRGHWEIPTLLLRRKFRILEPEM